MWTGRQWLKWCSHRPTMLAAARSWKKWSFPKEINSEYPLKGLRLKLKLQHFGHLMWRTDSLEKTLMLGKTEGRRRRGWPKGWDSWMASLTQWTWIWTNSRIWPWTGNPGMLQSTGSQRVRHDWATEQPPEAGRNTGAIFFRAFGWNTALLTPEFQLSSLKNCERIRFSCFRPPS